MDEVTAIIIGCAVGGSVLVIIVVVALVIICVRGKKEKKPPISKAAHPGSQVLDLRNQPSIPNKPHNNHSNSRHSSHSHNSSNKHPENGEQRNSFPKGGIWVNNPTIMQSSGFHSNGSIPNTQILDPAVYMNQIAIGKPSNFPVGTSSNIVLSNTPGTFTTPSLLTMPNPRSPVPLSTYPKDPLISTHYSKVDENDNPKQQNDKPKQNEKPKKQDDDDNVHILKPSSKVPSVSLTEALIPLEPEYLVTTSSPRLLKRSFLSVESQNSHEESEPIPPITNELVFHTDDGAEVETDTNTDANQTKGTGTDYRTLLDVNQTLAQSADLTALQLGGTFSDFNTEKGRIYPNGYAVKTSIPEGLNRQPNGHVNRGFVSENNINQASYLRKPTGRVQRSVSEVRASKQNVEKKGKRNRNSYDSDRDNFILKRVSSYETGMDSPRRSIQSDPTTGIRRTQSQVTQDHRFFPWYRKDDNNKASKVSGGDLRKGLQGYNGFKPIHGDKDNSRNVDRVRSFYERPLSTSAVPYPGKPVRRTQSQQINHQRKMAASQPVLKHYKVNNDDLYAVPSKVKAQNRISQSQQEVIPETGESVAVVQVNNPPVKSPITEEPVIEARVHRKSPTIHKPIAQTSKTATSDYQELSGGDYYFSLDAEKPLETKSINLEIEGSKIATDAFRFLDSEDSASVDFN